jgi:hypothetical protein
MSMNIRKLRKNAVRDIENCRDVGLRGWTFKWMYSKRGLGYCDFDKKLIAISKPLAKVNCERRMMDTLRHEIAHALAGPDAGHGILWKKIARKVGCDAHEFADPKVDGIPLVTKIK